MPNILEKLSQQELREVFALSPENHDLYRKYRSEYPELSHCDIMRKILESSAPCPAPGRPMKPDNMPPVLMGRLATGYYDPNDEEEEEQEKLSFWQKVKRFFSSGEYI